MNPTTRSLLVLHDDPVLLSRLRAAAAAYQLQHVPDWCALRERLRAAPPSPLAVVDPYAGTRPCGGPAPQLQSLLQDFPSLTVMAALSLARGRACDLCMLGRWGVTEVIELDLETSVQRLHQRLANMPVHLLRDFVERRLAPAMGAHGRVIVRAAVEVVMASGDAAALGRAVHASTRTLDRWCAEEGLPSPRRLLLWFRVLLAAELLIDAGRSTESVALACGYNGKHALHRAFRHVLRLSPSQVRKRDPFAIASAAFLAELSPSAPVAAAHAQLASAAALADAA